MQRVWVIIFFLFQGMLQQVKTPDSNHNRTLKECVFREHIGNQGVINIP